MRLCSCILFLPLAAGAQASKWQAEQSLGERIAAESTETRAQPARVPATPDLLQRRLVVIEGPEIMVWLIIANEPCDDDAVAQHVTLGTVPNKARVRILIRF